MKEDLRINNNGQGGNGNTKQPDKHLKSCVNVGSDFGENSETMQVVILGTVSTHALKESY